MYAVQVRQIFYSGILLFAQIIYLICLTLVDVYIANVSNALVGLHFSLYFVILLRMDYELIVYNLNTYAFEYYITCAYNKYNVDFRFHC